MLKLARKLNVDRRILKCDFVRYTQQSVSIVNRENKEIYIITPREDSVFSLKDSYLEKETDVKCNAGDNDPYVDGARIRFLNLGPTALFGKYKLTISSVTEIETINDARTA